MSATVSASVRFTTPAVRPTRIYRLSSLAAAIPLRSEVMTYRMDQANKALRDLRIGKAKGAKVADDRIVVPLGQHHCAILRGSFLFVVSK
jgi:hypothetical protein